MRLLVCAPRIMAQFARRFFCSRASGSTHSFITTPIFYVNAAPHIGHLYTAVLADAAHRWNKIRGATPAVLSTGTDEHGLKIQKAAELEGVTPRELCDRVSVKFKDLFDVAGVDYSHYVRTTEQRHVDTVNRFWRVLCEGGHIYRGSYEGWYSIPDEAFLSQSQVTDGEEPGSKVSVESGHVVEWTSEENYMFRLTAFRDRLLEWVDAKPYPIIPESSRQRVRHWLLNELNSDLSVSRPRSRLQWGIPVPNDNSQTVYVWLDALVNYLTISHPPTLHPSHPPTPHPSHTHNPSELHGALWPATNQIVGKDILRFHAVYWPGFLMAAKLPLPRRIISHAHWTMGRSKMSKSKANVVDPHDQISRFGVEPLRYFLLREGSLQQDGDYSEERLVAMTNSDLPNTMGNLLQRVSTPRLNPGGRPRLEFSLDLFPSGGLVHNSRQCRAKDEDYTLIRSLVELPGIVETHYDAFEFNKGLAAVMQCFYQANVFIDRHAPWELVRVPDQHAWLQTVLSVAVETLRLCSILLYPVIPTSSRNVLQRIGFEQDLNLKSDASLQCLLTSEEGVKRFNETNVLSLGAPPIFSRLNGAPPIFSRLKAD